MQVNEKFLLTRAQKGKYAVPHFNVSNLETMQAVFNVCNKLNAPAIMAASESAISYASIPFFVSTYRLFASTTKAHLGLHMDHGRNLELIKKCIDSGYTSVMIDASHEKFDKNIALTRKVVRWAHSKGVSVEAELGTIGGKEDYVKGRIIYTDPAQAKFFVEKTNCDALAIAVGTSHGAYKFPGASHLYMNVLKEVRSVVKIPLVLHGASGVLPDLVKKANRYGGKIVHAHGVSDTDIRQAIKFGITKINIDTDLRIAFTASVREYLAKNKESIDYRSMLAQARLEMEKVIEKKIRLFGCVNRC